MNKEELKQEAEEWLCNNLHSASEEDFIKAMVDIAMPREERIKELEKENDIFKKANAIIAQQRDDRDADISILENRIEELESQLSLKIINCIKSHLCKQDEDYDKPIISPKFLSDVLDQMVVDGFEES